MKQKSKEITNVKSRQMHSSDLRMKSSVCVSKIESSQVSHRNEIDIAEVATKQQYFILVVTSTITTSMILTLAIIFFTHA